MTIEEYQKQVLELTKSIEEKDIKINELTGSINEKDTKVNDLTKSLDEVKDINASLYLKLSTQYLEPKKKEEPKQEPTLSFDDICRLL